MPKRRSFMTYTYDELDAKAQETARDWYRDGASEMFDGEPTITDALEMLRHAGFAISAIYWSGFCQQGDGACFEGTFTPALVDPAKMRSEAPQDAELHAIADESARLVAGYSGVTWTVKQTGHYYHVGCTAFEFDYSGECDDSSSLAAEKAHEENARRAMRWIYRQLERDFEYQTSDECVAENIRSNDYAFTKHGKRSVTL